MSTKAADESPPVVAIAGPTAAGKSSLAMELCQQWPGGAEIVSVDSAQVYRGMDIGTAKPDAAARQRVPHHLLDILDPAQSYSAARFAQDARGLVADIRRRGRMAVLVGGTMLYFKALFEGLSELPPADAAVRARLEAEARRLGWPALHARLAQVDPPTAARLHPNDAQRIQRALEIFELGGAPASRQFTQGRATVELGGRLLRVAVCPADRGVLHARIEQRLRAMLEQGLVEEVARLRDRGDLHAGLPSMRAVGYRQVWGHLEGHCDVARALELAIIATRQYAKRQLTWLRGENHWIWLDSTEPNGAARVLNLVNQHRQ